MQGYALCAKSILQTNGHINVFGVLVEKSTCMSAAVANHTWHSNIFICK